MKLLFTVKIDGLDKIEIENLPLFCDVSVTEAKQYDENTFYIFYNAGVFVNGHKQAEIIFAVSRLYAGDFHSQMYAPPSSAYRITKVSDGRCDRYEISTYAYIMRAICGCSY